jgi:hypothetical protein
MSEENKQQNTEAMQYDTVLPAVLVGYIILQNIHFRVGKNNAWEQMQTGFELEFKKKIYPRKESAEEAVEQMKKLYKKDEFEIHPVYWYGR